ncbi:MAG: sulfide/dihydroorotate dehydrogenase-like FAD/NAD-binding protein [Firmicutes bacterium]|nr:sulfide/dihydroorotate dehydrogenase-like FAD/NAD-binding protein [Bacillota bacterium]
MYKILEKRMLTDTIFEMKIEAPRVAKAALPGQFVIVKTTQKGERVPLTISDYDAEAGTVSIVTQAVGKSTMELMTFEEGDSICDFVGPLGCPTDLCTMPEEELKQKNIIFIAGGVGAAPIYPQVKWLKAHGIDCDVIIGARTKNLIILEDQMREVAKNVYISTDDGSYAFNGRVTDLLKKLVEEDGKQYNHAVAIGPMIMMKFAVMMTKGLGIPTVVSLNPIMVDGTGMCGACRVTIGDEVKFACVDGPEFDGFKVNFDEAMRRQTMYRTQEGRAKLKFEEGQTHKNGGCGCGGDK